MSSEPPYCGESRVPVTVPSCLYLSPSSHGASLVLPSHPRGRQGRHTPADSLIYDKQASLSSLLTELDPPAAVHTTGLVRTLPARPGSARGYFTQQRPDETQCHVKASHLPEDALTANSPEFPGSSTFLSAPPLPFAHNILTGFMCL